MDARLLEGVELLQKKGLKVYLATNQEKYRAEYLLHTLGFKEIFDRIFVSSELGITRRHPEFFEKILETLQLKAEEVLFWDDHMKYVEAAQQVGIQAHFYTNFEQYQKVMEKYVSESIG